MVQINYQCNVDLNFLRISLFMVFLSLPITTLSVISVPVLRRTPLARCNVTAECNSRMHLGNRLEVFGRPFTPAEFYDLVVPSLLDLVRHRSLAGRGGHGPAGNMVQQKHYSSNEGGILPEWHGSGTWFYTKIYFNCVKVAFRSFSACQVKFPVKPFK